MKKILTVQDISCIGKCSLTVALPIMSAMGVETAILPTAVLSTHTMFSGFTFCDLTNEIAPITRHWKEQGFSFEAIGTGYLGSFEQIDKVAEIFDIFGEGAIKVVDPVMGDNGKLYPAFDMAFAKKMATLCSKADIIIPNLTEACFMLDIPYVENEYSREYIEDILRRLTALGCKKAVVTGVSFDGALLGCMGYDSETGEFFEDYNQRIEQKYHGTGDIFSSVFIGSLVRGMDIKSASALAADFVCDSIIATQTDETPIDYGVHFEKVIPSLCERLKELK
ncbi:MAG: pyridoxamine kinase [Ruminococcaceae bacterium]|nr:pyridoxamine kinase [Oscillospiraceae bacterium]